MGHFKDLDIILRTEFYLVEYLLGCTLGEHLAGEVIDQLRARDLVREDLEITPRGIALIEGAYQSDRLPHLDYLVFRALRNSALPEDQQEFLKAALYRASVWAGLISNMANGYMSLLELTTDDLCEGTYRVEGEPHDTREN